MSYTAPTYLPKAVYPSESWDSTPGSGFESAPTDPTLSTAKALIGLVDVPLQRFDEDFYFKVQAFAKGGIKEVRCHLEGNVTVEATPRRWEYKDSNNNTQKFFGYIFKLDYSRFPEEGSFNVYFEAVPNDTAMQSTIIGPHLFHVAYSKYEVEVTVDGVQPTNVGLERFATIPEAINYCKAGNYQHALIEIVDDSVTYRLNSGDVRSTVSGWYHIKAAPGLNVTLSEPTPGTTWNIPSGCRIGSGIEIDVKNIDKIYNADGLYWIWYDNVEIYSSLFLSQATWRNSSELNQRQYFTESKCSSLFQGPNYNSLIRNSTFGNIQNETISYTKQIYGVDVFGYNSNEVMNIGSASSILNNNLIYTNVKVHSTSATQIWKFGVKIDGLAIVNCTGYSVDDSKSSQFVDGGNHTLIYNNSFVNQPITFTGAFDSYSELKNNVFRNTVNSSATFTGTGIDKNVRTTGSILPGETNSTTIADVSTLFVDADNGDFRPGSNLKPLTDYPLIAFDQNSEVRETLSTYGAIENSPYVRLTKGSTVELTQEQFEALVQETSFDSIGLIDEALDVKYGKKQAAVKYNVQAPESEQDSTDDWTLVDIDFEQIPLDNDIEVELPIGENIEMKYTSGGSDVIMTPGVKYSLNHIQAHTLMVKIKS